MAIPTIHFYRQLIKLQIETLRTYVEESGNSLLAKQNTLEEELKQLLEEAKVNDDTEAIIENFWNENKQYYSDFPCYFNESAFLIVYSFLEASLFRVCKYAMTDLNYFRKGTLITRVISENNIWQSKKYLETTCGVSLKSGNSMWKKLDKLRDLRNFLAHTNLNLNHTRNLTEKGEKKKTVIYINRVFKSPLKIDRAEKYKIEKHQFIITTLELIDEYLCFTIDKVIKACK